ncbi:tRNA (adenosine(37)-N6)-threonylcarbamoyltransferase complex dimerization subunit type 1 TsaB [Methylocystis sp.]|uniref:tRNA (adenosine(37)-N6)-threonylcarbamoyltransferase complex dimerization subunit type 1 TsaB n=1 Tax=Methylocystis sp. TaxID=1911079 RepID=UPI003DA2168C
MNILAFDTCFDACSVCVAQQRAGAVVELASTIEFFETGHAERLVPMIGEAMHAAGMAFESLDRITVTVGPGTFTGTRIGIAAARGLALATQTPVAGASSLAVMAEVAVRRLGMGVPGELLAVAVDARRGEVYVQLFGTGGLDARSPPLLLAVEDAAGLGGSALLVLVGSGAAAVAAAAQSMGRAARAELAALLPDACALAAMAPAIAPSEGALGPLYLRPPDAKPQAGKAIARVAQ